jgi:hypothetical protein
VNTTAVNALLPGISVKTLDPHYPPAHVKQASLTIEQPVKGAAVFRITHLFTHGSNLDQDYQYTVNPSTYVWDRHRDVAADRSVCLHRDPSV